MSNAGMENDEGFHHSGCGLQASAGGGRAPAHFVIGFVVPWEAEPIPPWSLETPSLGSETGHRNPWASSGLVGWRTDGQKCQVI